MWVAHDLTKKKKNDEFEDDHVSPQRQLRASLQAEKRKGENLVGFWVLVLHIFLLFLTNLICKLFGQVRWLSC